MKKLKKLSLARTAIALVLALLTTTTAWANVKYKCYIEVSLNSPYDNGGGITGIWVDEYEYDSNLPVELESGEKTIQVSATYWYMGGDPDPIEDSFNELTYFDVPTEINGCTTKSNDYFSATIRCDEIIYTYTVNFDANGGSGEMGPIEAQVNYGAKLPAGTFTAPEGYVFKCWNTEEDGNGDSYDDEGYIYNLADAEGSVTLYAQWGKNIATCDITVPDQSKKYTLGENTREVDMISYKFEDANYYAEVATQVDAVVKDGNKTLTLGTDYMFGRVTFNGEPLSDDSNVGDECKVEIVGIGDYAGSKWVEFMVTTPDADGTWGDLAWSFHAGTLTISKKDDVEGNVTMDATTQGSYPWFSNARYIKTITLGEGITSIAASAFAGTSNENSYSNLAKLNLPTTLTTIGENAFAFCTSLTVDLDDILAKNIEIGNNAFNLIGCLKGTVSDNADNADKMALLSQANGDITLSGRTLYKDGNWNTLCLPFDVADGDDTDELTFTGTPLEGATVKELKTSETNFKDGTLSLSFKDATKIDAGKPYLIMWASGDDLVNPKFTNVKIISIDPATDVTSIDDYVTFMGTYAPVTFGSANKSILFLGDDNTLYWPDGNEVTTINAFRAYFQLTDLTLAVKVRNIVLNPDGEASGIEALTADAEASSAAWYTLSGVKLQGKPTDRGLYLHGKQKVFVP